MVIPDGDRTAIFTGFEGLLGLPGGFLANREQIIQNRSMTTPEAEFVRSLNKELAGQMSWDEYTVMVRRALILNMVEKRRPAADEPRIQTPNGPPTRPRSTASGSPGHRRTRCAGDRGTQPTSPCDRDRDQ